MQSHMQLHLRVERSDGTEKPEDISELAELPYAFSGGLGGGSVCVCVSGRGRHNSIYRKCML